MEYKRDHRYANFIFVCVVGLIHVGDELKEVNGIPVDDKKPEEIIRILVSLICLCLHVWLHSFCVCGCVLARVSVCVCVLSKGFSCVSAPLPWQNSLFVMAKTSPNSSRTPCLPSLCWKPNTSLSLHMHWATRSPWMRCFVVPPSRLRCRPQISSVMGLNSARGDNCRGKSLLNSGGHLRHKGFWSRW